jgi:hypothetical protein
VSRLDARTIVGAGVFVVGIALIGSAVLDLRDAPPAGAAGTPRPSLPAAASDAAAPSTSAVASPSATAVSPTASAVRPTATPDPFSRVSAFYQALVPGVRDADADVLAALLHPATIERYGRDACVQSLGQLNDPTFDVIVHGVGPPAPWDYATDGVTTTIPDALAVEATVTANGATEARELHVAIVEGEVRWFTDCGTPIG